MTLAECGGLQINAVEPGGFDDAPDFAADIMEEIDEFMTNELDGTFAALCY